MADRPILFSAPMVRAILAGTKTQTRRAMKNPPEWRTDHHPHGWQWKGKKPGEPVLSKWPDAKLIGQEIAQRATCPYGQPGDRLWVRETWYCDDYRVQRGPYLKPADMDIEEARSDGTLIYRASSGDRPYEAEQPVWRPAIHMPRWASRITLEVTGVRVERLQDISEADAIAEGIERVTVKAGATVYPLGNRYSHDAVEAYSNLWEQINGPESWSANPWVWVVEFKRLEAANHTEAQAMRRAA